jgi:type II secretory ATPase GspE/PulE/Tfp pilus assembly ATPase PilB-like protein
MDLDRVFKEPIRVSVGMIDGEVKVGFLSAFSPTADGLILQPPSQGSGSSVQDAVAMLSFEKIGFLGFHTRYNPLSESRAAASNSLTVHLAGGRSFMVKAVEAELRSPVGFYADPIAGGSLYAEMFFFTKAVNAAESKDPLGAMLVKEGILNSKALERGLAELAHTRNIPIGQILVEQDKLTSTDIDQVADVQKAQMKHGRPMRLGEILIEAGLATEEDVRSALEEQKRRRGKRLGEILVERGVVDDQKIAMTLAKKFNIPYANLDRIRLNPDAVKLIPAELITRYSILPVDYDDKCVTIALSDPLAFDAIDMVRFLVNRQIREIVVAPTQLQLILDRIQIAQAVVGKEVGAILENLETETQDEAVQADITVASDAESGIARLINQIIIDAWKRGASDIHVEPNGPEQDVNVRIRIDGICEPYQKIPPAYRSQIVSRIKVVAKLDITEHRKPQDGKVRFRFGDQEIELRVATIPTFARGEDVVMRILPKGKPLRLEELTLSARNMREINKVINRPYGLILAVGPTGSGKTTTVHALVGALNTGQRKIWTAEDPIEITQDGLRQVQINSKIGFTFAAAMRAFLRADPDIILVGEMRDLETASMGIEASLTGHLVFSTLHTNTAPDTVIRLIDMGLDPFVFSDTCLAILAQRLSRRLCGKCRERYTASEKEREQFDSYYGAANLQKVLGSRPLMLYRPVGCVECAGRGYKGRLALQELLVNEKEMRAAIQHRVPAGELRILARKGGMRTLLQDGVEKCIQGLTDIHQVLAVCSE